MRDTYLLTFQEWYPTNLLHFIIYATLELILLSIASIVIVFLNIVSIQVVKKWRKFVEKVKGFINIKKQTNEKIRVSY